MGLRINTNIASLNAQRQLSNSTSNLQHTMGQLSSGLRINKAADDAAGLAVSENLRSDLRSLSVAKRNASDGVSLIQTAEGGLMETTSMLIRLKELAVQSASDTIGNRDRELLDKEFVQLKDEIDRLASTTEFNGIKLLTGDNKVAHSEDSNNFPLEIQIGKDYYADADGTARNPMNLIRFDFSELNGFTHGDGSLNLGENQDGTRVHRKENAQESIGIIDDAIFKVNAHRATLGAVQNRLSSTISNLAVQIENTAESNSRIRDVDFASATADLTKNSILQQAGTSVLANANSQPQIALALLK